MHLLAESRKPSRTFSIFFSFTFLSLAALRQGQENHSKKPTRNFVKPMLQNNFHSIDASQILGFLTQMKQ
jgi:hypothetical protein